jgi:hypothetical protein
MEFCPWDLLELKLLKLWLLFFRIKYADFNSKTSPIKPVMGGFQVDPSTGDADEEGYEDEYQLEDSEVRCPLHMLSAFWSFTCIHLATDIKGYTVRIVFFFFFRICSLILASLEFF